MMKIYADLCLLAVVVVYVVDLSGFTDTWLGLLSAAIGRQVRSLRPFSCSQCMTWWSGIAVCIATGTLTWGTVAFCALLAFMALPIGQLLHTLRALILDLISKFQI